MKMAMVLGGLMLILAGSGCAAVQPWQKGALAQPTMAWEPDPLGAALARHVHFSKEASHGDAGLAGGGCGCN